MPKTICIKNAAWVAAWDAAAKRHCYRRDIDVAFTGDRIDFVGKGYKGKADETVDGKDSFVIPGLVDIHSHPNIEPFYKGLREEHGVPGQFMSGLYERSLAYWPDNDGKLAAAEVAYAELLTSGVTSLADLSGSYPGWIDLIAKSGLRGFVAPGYASSRWHMDNDWELKYKWDERAGRQRFEEALSVIKDADNHPSGRLSGIVCPMQIDTCTEDLLRDSMDVARDSKRPFTTHCAQAVMEFNVMVQRHGKTPVQWAHEIGLLGPKTILGHAIFIDEHSWLHWHTRKDLALLVETGTTVAHCPTPFARYGQTLEDFGRYRRAGVNMGIGTDTSPHNMIEEMRWAAVLGRIAAEDINTLQTADIFHAATVGGATALGRDDIGRIAPDMKADLVLVDLRHQDMRPARDPLRSLIYTAAERAVRAVYVDGVKVVDEGRVTTLNRGEAVARLEEAQIRMMEKTPGRDFRKRTADQVTPLSLPLG